MTYVFNNIERTTKMPGEQAKKPAMRGPKEKWYLKLHQVPLFSCCEKIRQERLY